MVAYSPHLSVFVLTGHRRAVSIACGQTSSMAVLDNGDVSSSSFVLWSES